MENKLPQQESVQQKKGTMQKYMFNNKIGYMDAILVSWGLTVGLMYCGWVALNPTTSKSDDCKEEDEVKCSTLEIFYLIGLILVGILITCQFLVVRVLLDFPPKPGTTMKLFRICITCGVLMLTVDFVRMMLGYHAIEVFAFVILLAVVPGSLIILATIIADVCIYEFNKSCKEEKRIMKEETMEFEILLDNMESV